jgi:addiction module RelE/StbE family toxin
MAPRTRTTRRAQRKLVWTDRAVRDLREIDGYIRADDPAAAARWISKLLTAAERAGRFPHSGHIVREKGREDVRQILVGTYRIVYLIRERQVDVLTVFEGHHLLPDDVT